MRLSIGARTLLAIALVLAAVDRVPAGDPSVPVPPPVGPALAAPEGLQAAAPRLEIERETIDLGTVMRGSPAEGSFVLRNRGSDVLRVLSAKPG